MALFGNSSDGEAQSNIIRIGEVSSIDPVKGTARVAFDDEDRMVSYDLPVIQRNTLENHDYWMPDIGEDVLCVFLPTGSEDGFILGSFYADEIRPPANTENIRMVEFADGTKVSYDRESHELKATIDGTEIKANRDTVDITGDKTVNVESATAINIKSAVITLTMGGTTMRLDNGHAVITTSDIAFTGNGQFYGDLKVNGDLKVDGTIKASGTIRENQGV
jgi:phage baseplate assembly protein V